MTPQRAGPSRLRAPLVVAVSLAVLVGGCDAAARSTGPKAGQGASLSVRGNELVASNGRRVVLRGFVVYALPFYYDTGGVRDPALQAVTSYAWTHRAGLFAAIRRTGANAVRIPISLGVYEHDRYLPGGGAGYLRRLSQIVGAARAAGLYVILVWWDSPDRGAQLLRSSRTLFPMMAAVHRLFVHDPGVMYEPYNEPHGISWGEWLPTMVGALRYWRRSLGYHGVLIFDTIGYSWDVSPLYMQALLDAARLLQRPPNVLFANHRYPNGASCFCGANRQTWTRSVEPYLRTFPVVGTEYGLYDGLGTPSVNWGRGFLRYVARRAIPDGMNGAIAFVWEWVDPNSMTSPTTHRLTRWGRVVVSELLGPVS
ncbi:MAG TPA: cellulase family glycosylhydrolase [Acidimicrobiales bacterium]|nr:cellulase family glycosylhydrolase [Acidimicrobiales bacterium]